MPTPRPPSDLGPAGRRLWRDLLGAFDMDAGEVAVLGEACRTVDDLARLRLALADADAVVVGSTGQPMPNRLFEEVRRQRETLTRLIAALKLPDLDADSGRSVASLRAQKAARTRWGHGNVPA